MSTDLKMDCKGYLNYFDIVPPLNNYYKETLQMTTLIRRTCTYIESCLLMFLRDVQKSAENTGIRNIPRDQSSCTPMGSFLHIAQPDQSMAQMLQIGPCNLLRLSLSLPTVILL